MGLLFVGVAVGPTIGGLLISSTGDLLSVFYLAAAIHLFYLVSMLFIVPESLSKEEMSNNREAHAERVKLELVKEERGGSGTWYWCWIAIKRAFFFLKPLIVLLPRKRAGTLKGRHWNLTCLMISYGAVALIMVSTIAPICPMLLDINLCTGKLPVQVPICIVCLWMDLATAWLLAQHYRRATSYPPGHHLTA